MEAAPPLLQVKDLKVWFRTREGTVRAVDGIDFAVPPGRTVALVGESGSGKSVTALALTRLVPDPPGVYAGGEILFKGRDVLRMKRSDLRDLRGASIAYVFQDPATALNPVLRIGYQLTEVLRQHRRRSAPSPRAERGLAGTESASGSAPRARQAQAVALLEMVGIHGVPRCLRAYPHELSGGMQQRAMLSMALACRPDLLVADEPTTALDVTIQAQVLQLIKRLQKQLGMAVLLITHNFALVADMADEVQVMREGRIVEAGPTEEVLTRPQHPYTRALLAAIPRLPKAHTRNPN